MVYKPQMFRNWILKGFSDSGDLSTNYIKIKIFLNYAFSYKKQ